MKEKTSAWFKVLALCTAIGLGGAYVWRQQQQAALQIEKPVERTVLSGSKSKVIAPTPLPVDQDQTDRVLMPGSKSASSVFKPEQERTLMKSSKSGIIELKPSVEKDRVLMPGSKSFIVIPEKPEATPPPAKPKADEP